MKIQNPMAKLMLLLNMGTIHKRACNALTVPLKKPSYAKAVMAMVMVLAMAMVIAMVMVLAMAMAMVIATVMVLAMEMAMVIAMVMAMAMVMVEMVMARYRTGRFLCCSPHRITGR